MAILAHPGWRRIHALPVVDRHGVMLGVVRYETLRRLEEDAAALHRARGLQRAALAGAVIPMVLTAIGQDPAQSSSIILTTVTDVTGFFSFLGVATMLAPMI